MYYIQFVQNEDGDLQLRHECRQCHHVDETAKSTSVMVLNNECENTNDHSSVISEYTKYDPTIPRLYTIPCPNESCPSNATPSSEMPEIMYLRENHEKMSYIYLCCVCDHTWNHSMS